MRLFEPDRHETLCDLAWDEQAARAAIARIVDDVHGAYLGVDGLWPIHPLDVSDERADVLKPLYYGAGGVIWALERLRQTGFTVPERDYRPAARDLLARSRVDTLRLNGRPQFSYPMGETGLLMLQWSLAPSDDLAEKLVAAIDASRDDPSLGFLWGSPGAALAASGIAGPTIQGWTATCGPMTSMVTRSTTWARCTASPASPACCCEGDTCSASGGMRWSAACARPSRPPRCVTGPTPTGR